MAPTHHEELLATALMNMLLHVGVLDPNYPEFTGPELLAAAEDFCAHPYQTPVTPP